MIFHSNFKMQETRREVPTTRPGSNLNRLMEVRVMAGDNRDARAKDIQSLVKKIEGLKTFMSKTANRVGFVGDGLNGDEPLIDGACDILHDIEIDVRDHLDDMDEMLAVVRAMDEHAGAECEGHHQHEAQPDGRGPGISL
jgi:hypothetical protein